MEQKVLRLDCMDLNNLGYSRTMFSLLFNCNFLIFFLIANFYYNIQITRNYFFYIYIRLFEKI